ncbi:MAG: cellulase family glycosylhydrolase [Anaerolineae bacterium]
MKMRIDGRWFKDEQGRTLLLRGINLGGSTKVPSRPDGATHIREGFFEHRDVSFVGRPFPLEEADEHFARLRAWGFDFLRFLVTWEAIEHAGPGIYDEAYLDYLSEVVRKAGEHGLHLFIDPHQDVWSRFSGGDGAPGWTFEAIGMDMTRFKETGAAIVHQTHGDPFPRMIWPTNYGKLATATMFTLFFGGDDFAPETTIDGEPVQAYLQRHYIDAMKQVAERLKGLEYVVGYDIFNEPSAGYIGRQNLNSVGGLLLNGESPTPFQSMLLGAGYPQEVEIWGMGLLNLKRQGTRLVNPEGVSVWREGVEPLWKANGVWDLDDAGRPVLCRPHHFARVGDREVDFNRDYLRPFANRYAREMRAVHPGAFIFVEGVPESDHMDWSEEDAPEIAHACHWYDGITLFTKSFRSWFTVDIHTMRPVIGPKRVQRTFAKQVGTIERASEEKMGGVPTLIGEFGIPFDMNEGEAYRTGDFSRQVQALDASFRALEANLVSYTLWNYTADNTNARGDQWNGEDLSIFSVDQKAGSGDIDDGGRALEAALRPHPRAVAGEPLRMEFDPVSRTFEFVFRHEEAVQAPTLFYVPNFHYPQGYSVEVSDGRYEVDPDAQTLRYEHGLACDVHWIRLRPICAEPVGLMSREERRAYSLRGLIVVGAVVAAGALIWRALTRRRKEK